MAGTVWWQEGEAAAHIASAARKERRKLVPSWLLLFPFFFFSQSRTPGPWVVPTTFKVHLPSSFELLWKRPLDSPRSVSSDTSCQVDNGKEPSQCMRRSLLTYLSAARYVVRAQTLLSSCNAGLASAKEYPDP